MKRAAAALSLIWALTPAAGHALTIEEIVSQVWTRFDTECRLALTDPQTYLSTLQAKYPSTNAQASPDGGFYVLWTQEPVGPSDYFGSNYLSQGTNGLGNVTCDVSYGSGSSDGWSPEAMDASFRAEAVRRGVTSLAGGVMHDHDITADRMLGDAPDFDTYDYVMTGPIGPGYLTEASITGVDFTLTVTVVGRTNHPPAPPKAATAASAAPAQSAPSAAAPGPATGPAAGTTQAGATAFAQAVRMNLGLALRLCIEADGNIPSAVAAFRQAGFDYRPMPEANGDVWHRFFAPAETVRAEMLQGQMAPSCDIHTNHLPPQKAGPLVGSMLDQAAPGRFHAATTPPGTCAVYEDNGPLPLVVSVGATDGTSGCAALGSTIISIFKAV